MPTGDDSHTAHFEELRAQLEGVLILPGDPAYEENRRVWNGDIDRRPAAIVKCRTTNDVVASVRFARSHGVRATVRGGGHSVAGSSVLDGALVIDLSLMRGVTVDAATRTVRVQGGALWKDVDQATQAHGLAVPGGFVSTTGVGGFTLGGGIAWVSRKLGLACDSLVGADVVTARSEVLRVSPTERPELLWGLRGGGGNFGVVTSFDFVAQPVGPIVYGGFRMFSGDRAPELLRWAAAMYDRTPEEFNLLTVLTTAPPAPFVPAEFHGKRAVVIAVCYLGPVEKGAEAARELRELPGAFVDQIGPLPYVNLQAAFDPLNPPGVGNYWKSLYMAKLPEATIEAVFERFQRVPTPLTEIHFQYFGGAVSRVAREASAVGHRDSPFLFNLIGRWTDPSDRERTVSFVRELWETLRPASTGGVYVNFLTEESPDLTRAAYGERIYERLRALKHQYDPEDFFHSSHSIPPPPT